jgi:uncharacterized RDD family membrane protein YckC
MTNPYQTPEAELTDNKESEDQQDELAKRSSRFLAAIIDGLIGMIISIPFWLVSGAWDFITSGVGLPFTYSLAAGAYGFIGFTLVHFYFLNKNGQTVGKKLLRIRIIGINGQLYGAPPLLFKRYLPLTAASLIPLVGQLFILIDTLFIFRKDRRCVHDLIAGTKVVSC